jgi:hypothetical protein
VPGRVRLTQARRGDELADGAWPVEQHVKELAARGLSHNLEDGRHAA